MMNLCAPQVYWKTEEWLRIYPVPLKFLKGIKVNNENKSFKYSWLEIELIKRTDDFRPESFKPVNYDFSDVTVLSRINTTDNWKERKEHCLKKVYKNLTELINDSKAPKNVSLAVFKPARIVDFIAEPDAREWRNEWTEIRKQQELFKSEGNQTPETMIRKVPFKFYYKFLDDLGRESRLMIEDWELGQLYWNCLKTAKNDEAEALKKVRERFLDDLALKKDLYLFLGTTMKWHRRRASNPFVIVGVFYPPKAIQGLLFEKT
jgi:hypothetical protein